MIQTSVKLPDKSFNKIVLTLWLGQTHFQLKTILSKVLTEEMYSRQNSINENNVISIKYTDSQNEDENWMNWTERPKNQSQCRAEYIDGV